MQNGKKVEIKLKIQKGTGFSASDKSLLVQGPQTLFYFE
jgi:hypothetical protein